MTTPLVSISCITYNHAPYIRECLEGFLMQKTNFPFEILIHDDASTDGTADIIREYEVKYPDLIKPILREKNLYSQGIRSIDRFNYERAQGKYIALCEGDDFWTDPNKLQIQFDFMESHPDYSLHCHQRVIVNDLRKICYKNILAANLPEDEEQLCHDLLCNRYYLPTQTLFIRKSNLEERMEAIKQTTEGFPMGDVQLVIHLSLSGKVCFASDVMSAYRVGAGSVTHFDNPVKLNHFRQNAIKGLYFLADSLNHPEWKEDIYNAWENNTGSKDTKLSSIKTVLRRCYWYFKEEMLHLHYYWYSISSPRNRCRRCFFMYK